MKVDELIATLQRVREAKGNIEVNVTSFCGTNSAHVLFDIEAPRKNFNVSSHTNDLGQFCLHVNISQTTRDNVAKGVADMKRLGHRYYRSQFVGEFEGVKEGLSPCEWHTPW